MLKKSLALILALVLCLGILAGCQQAPAETTAPPAETTKPADTTAPAETTEPEPTSLFDPADNVVIEIWSPASSLDLDNCYAKKLIEQTTNAKVSVFEYDSAETYTATMAEQKVPMLSFSNTVETAQLYGPDGAYINWLDYIDQMPNVKAMLEDERWAKDVAKFTYAEGVMYGLPVFQTGYTNLQGYLYRDDIFEKHGLTFPTTQEEFYNTLVKLKELYPDSYPLVIHQMGGNMQGLEYWCTQWGANHQLIGYFNTIMKFDHETKTYFFAQVSEPVREAVAFLNKLMDEGLMHPSSLTMDNAGRQEAFATDTSFITYGLVSSYNGINTAVDRNLNPNFSLAIGAPIAFGSQGVAGGKEASVTAYSLLASNLLDEEELNNVLKYVDWLYSEEGITLTNWGVEGENYEVDANGNKVWKEGFDRQDTGLGAVNLVGCYELDSFMVTQPENYREGRKLVEKYATVPRDPALTYTEEEQEYMDTYYKTLYDASLAELQKFILGQRDTETEWEAFTNEMKALKMDEIIKIHQDAYNRIYG